MPYEPSDIAAFQRAQAQQRRAVDIEQSRYRKGEGELMLELQAHPLWERFARHLESARKHYEDAAKAFENKISGLEMLPPEEYQRLKVQQIRTRSLAEGVGKGLDIAKALVLKGEEAAEELAAAELSKTG
jgi:hypothetical protein